jgi:hypothetical protein
MRANAIRPERRKEVGGDLTPIKVKNPAHRAGL